MRKTSGATRYRAYRIKMEKLKQKTWLLIVLVQLLHFLSVLLLVCGQ